MKTILLRASQGYPVEIDLQYPPQTRPEILYHGTATRFLDGIRQQGLQRMAGHYVHRSAEIKVAFQVGGRHGNPVLLTIRAGDMHRRASVFVARPMACGWFITSFPNSSNSHESTHPG